MSSTTKEYKVNIDGTYMNVIQFGSGKKKLVIIAGINLAGLDGQGEAISAAYDIFSKDYTVYLFDRKKVAPKEYSVEEMADDQFRVLKEIGIEKADFYGVSQGGMIGLAMAIRHPEIINKLVVCSTLAKASKEMLETVKIWSELAERKDVIHLNRAFFNMVCSESYRKQFEEVLPELEKVGTKEDCEHFLTFIKACAKIDLADKLKEIKCPVFVLGDTNDTVLGIEETHRLIKELGCESYIYNEYSHSVYDEAPDIKNRIFEFLKK